VRELNDRHGDPERHFGERVASMIGKRIGTLGAHVERMRVSGAEGEA
jgi:hypothetical protein